LYMLQRIDDFYLIPVCTFSRRFAVCTGTAI